ncbi:hypothetical protein E0M27_14235 [Bacillus mycoides]|nr:hypothetical protein E0M27_14235 [Bacillus mycoides]
MHNKEITCSSFYFLIFTWHGAEKGSDRFYAWLDALSYLKKRRFFPLFIYIHNKKSVRVRALTDFTSYQKRLNGSQHAARPFLHV